MNSRADDGLELVPLNRVEFVANVSTYFGQPLSRATSSAPQAVVAAAPAAGILSAEMLQQGFAKLEAKIAESDEKIMKQIAQLSRHAEKLHTEIQAVQGHVEKMDNEMQAMKDQLLIQNIHTENKNSNSWAPPWGGRK